MFGYDANGGRSMGTRVGFSLLELLVVIAIVFLIITLVVPFLGGAQNVARATQTQSMMKEFGQAVDSFRLDQDQDLPGVFDVVEMNRAENFDNGFTAMENALLELSGGLAYGAFSNGETFNFGPTTAATAENTAQTRWAVPSRIGLSTQDNPAYFVPDSRFLAVQLRGNSIESSQFASPIADNEADIPDLVDAWGQPILLWVENTDAPSTFTAIDEFISEDSDSNESARFYVASNAAFLQSQRLGRQGRSQIDVAGEEFSVIGGGVSAAQQSRRLMAMLGNPASPDQIASAGNVFPTEGRGAMLLQSAGQDGTYLSAQDSGLKQVGGGSATGLSYDSNFFTTSGTRLRGDNDEPTTIDVMDGFNDLFETIGG